MLMRKLINPKRVGECLLKKCVHQATNQIEVCSLA